MEADEGIARAIAVAVYVSVGLFAAIVGAHDAFTAFEFASRAGGILFLIGGLTLIGSGVVLCMPGRTWGLRVAMYSGSLGILIGLSLIVAQAYGPDREMEPIWSLLAIAALLAAMARSGAGLKRLWLVGAGALLLSYLYFSSGDHDERVVIWAAIVFANCLAALALWRVGPPAISWPQHLRAGVFGFASLGALVAIGQLWYTGQYVPSREPASLTVEPALGQLPDANGLEVARLSIPVVNSGQTRVRVLGSVYRVAGARVKLTDRSDAELAQQLDRPAVSGRPVFRYRKSSDWDLVQTGKVMRDGSWLDPGERLQMNALVYVPPDRYDVLRAQVQMLIAKGNALEINYWQPRRLTPFPGILGNLGWGIIARWQVDESSWFRDLTRSAEEVEVDWHAGLATRPGLARFPYIRVYVLRVGERRPIESFLDYQKEAEDLFGLATNVSATEVPLDHGALR